MLNYDTFKTRISKSTLIGHDAIMHHVASGKLPVRLWKNKNEKGE